METIVQLWQKCTSLIGIFKAQPPPITRCQLYKESKQYCPYSKAPQKHALEIVETIKWKTSNNVHLETQIVQQLLKQWRTEHPQFFTQPSQMTAMNTQSLQGLLHVADHKFRPFVQKIHEYLGFKLFDNERNVRDLRKIIRPQSLVIFQMELTKENTNQYNQFPNARFWIASLREDEIICQCLDNFVNNNDWIWQISKFDFGLWCQIGFDKATKGGFSESIALVTNKFSVKNSMTTLYIPGK